MARAQIALLRGVNVGRGKRIAMSDLRALVEGLGFQRVRTLLNSGNVVYASPRTSPKAAAEKIERALAEQLNLGSRVTVLSADELAAILASNPLGAVADNPSRHLVAVLQDADVRAALEPLTAQSWHPEVLALGQRVAHLWLPSGIIESRLAKAIERIAGDKTTTRNWSTLSKLNALVKAIDDQPPM